MALPEKKCQFGCQDIHYKVNNNVVSIYKEGDSGDKYYCQYCLEAERRLDTIIYSRTLGNVYDCYDGEYYIFEKDYSIYEDYLKSHGIRASTNKESATYQYYSHQLATKFADKNFDHLNACGLIWQWLDIGTEQEFYERLQR